MQAKKQSFILASASPRRKELLRRAGFNFKTVISNVDETDLLTGGLSPAQFACRAALAKANDVAEKFPEEIVVAADTVADFNGETIGKAENAEQAEQITRKLFGRPHKVITAIAIIRKEAGLELVDYDVTTVYPRKLTETEIRRHIESESWKDKAGAYAIQEGGDKFIDHIEGSETNVMGLSMELLAKMTKTIF